MNMDIVYVHQLIHQSTYPVEQMGQLKYGN